MFCSLDLVGKADRCIQLQKWSKAQTPYPCVTVQDGERQNTMSSGNKQEDGKCVGGGEVKDTSLR